MIVISESFRPRVLGWGVDPARVIVIPNWGPLGEIPAIRRDNAWAGTHGLTGRFVVAYTGLLGLKHDPVVLLELARHFNRHADVTLLVVGAGPGFDLVARRGHRGAPRVPRRAPLPAG